MPELLERYGNIQIIEGESGHIPQYIVLKPPLTESEETVLAHCHSVIGDITEILKALRNIRTSVSKEEYLHKVVEDKIKSHNVTDENREYIVNYILDELFLGYQRLGPLMRDDMLEEIMVNGVNSPVFVVHRKYGMCTSNVFFESHESIDNLIYWIAKYVNRELNEHNPLLDAHMPDGSRANVAIPPAAPNGPSITIRKFKKTPYTILDLIQVGTINVELASFLWVCIEGFGLSPVELIIAGGAGSGKTTLLNAMAMLIPKNERVVTVEDTLELNFSFIDNWVPLEASPSASPESHMSMQSLLRNSLRMRPDRVIVGEVRSSEAETLFVAMDIGLDGSMGTLHANNARETTIRLMGEPMNVPIRMMPLLDLIVVLNRIIDRRKGMIRRVTQVSEVSGIEGEVVQLGDLFLYDVSTDTIKRSNYPIILLEKIAHECGISKKRLNTELLIREKVLEYMINTGIKETDDVIDFFQKYHTNPKDVLSLLKDQQNNIDDR